VFLGAKVRSFSADLSWNTGGPSQLNVQLVDDPADGSLFSPAPLGSPVTFSFGSFTFSGLLQRYEKKRDSSGNPLYDASVVDPREILEGCELVVGGYSGAVTVRNVLSPFGHWESKGFGLSLANESGMPWFRVRDAVSALVNQPTVGSYGGPLHYRGYNYGLDLTEVPVPPDSYRIGGGVTVGLLEAISQVCEDGGHDFFVELSGANIRIRTVSRATQPPLGTMAALADSDYGVSATRISEGLECRNELTAAVLVGGQVTSLHQTAVLTQFWGWDVDGLPIVGAAHVLNFFDKAQPPQLIEAVNTEKMLLNASPVADVVANVRYECTTFEMRLAQANVESWENYITVHRPQIAQVVGFAGVFKNPGPGNAPVRANFVNGGPAAARAQAAGAIQGDGQLRKMRLFEFVRATADEFMGKKFLVGLPFIQVRRDPESGQVTTSWEVADSGYLEDGAQPLALSVANQDLFRSADGRFRAFVEFTNIVGVDLSKVSPTGAVIENGRLYMECQVDPTIISLNNDPRVLVTLPGAVTDRAVDPVGGVGPVGAFLQKAQNLLRPMIKQAVTPTKLAPATRVPAAAAIPLQSNISTYGPWQAQGAIGKVRVDQDPSLVPWNYGGYTLMNAAALARVSTAITNAQVAETAHLERVGAPSVGLGDVLQAGGPNVTNIGVQIGPQGVTTTYRFQTFSARFGVFGRHQTERLRKAGAAAVRLRRDVRVARHDVKQKGDAVRAALNAQKAFLDAQAKALKRETPHDVLHSYSELVEGTVRTQMGAMTEEEAVVVSNADDDYLHQRTAFMSWPGLFRAYTKTALPSGVAPSYGSGTPPAGILSHSTLDFWKGPNDLEVWSRGTTYEDMHAFAATGDHTAARPFGLRGPPVIVGWGFDLYGHPVPGSGATFESDHLLRQDRWKAGPLDPLWDQRRGVWTTHGVLGGTSSGIPPAGTGTMVVDGNGMGYSPMSVYNPFPDAIGSGRPVVAAYVPTHNHWRVLSSAGGVTVGANSGLYGPASTLELGNTFTASGGTSGPVYILLTQPTNGWLSDVRRFGTELRVTSTRYVNGSPVNTASYVDLCIEDGCCAADPMVVSASIVEAGDAYRTVVVEDGGTVYFAITGGSGTYSIDYDDGATAGPGAGPFSHAFDIDDGVSPADFAIYHVRVTDTCGNVTVVPVYVTTASCNGCTNCLDGAPYAYTIEYDGTGDFAVFDGRWMVPRSQTTGPPGLCTYSATLDDLEDPFFNTILVSVGPGGAAFHADDGTVATYPVDDVPFPADCCAPAVGVLNVSVGTGTPDAAPTPGLLGVCECTEAVSCCSGAIPSTLYAHFTSVSGCADINGLTVALVAASGTAWVLDSASGGAAGCNSPTDAAFNCTTGAFTITFGADNIGTGTPVTFRCSPFRARYQFTLTFSAEETCCSGTVSVLLNGTP
jgi:hypothetical protein